MFTLPADLTSLGITDVVSIDAEYISRKGEHVVPVCFCAKSLVSGTEWRVFNSLNTLPRCPFADDSKTLFVSFAAPAEWSYYLACGWQLPSFIIDLFAEECLAMNGVKDEKGKRKLPTLLTTMSKYGLDAITAAEKEGMRDLILRGGPYTDTEQEDILEYCDSDVVAVEKLLPAVLPQLNVREAMVRGSYTRAVAWTEFNGIPVDKTLYRELRTKWPALKAALAGEVEKKYGYGVFVPDAKGKIHWSDKGFSDLVVRQGLDKIWPKTPAGKFKTADPDKGSDDEKVFKEMAQKCPYLEPLRQTRKTLTNLRNFDLPVGEDGRCRTFPWPWMSVTGRNQPRAGFIFGLPHWARNLIKPPKGRAIAYVDLRSAEYGIAAALSGDEEMIAAYHSREDVYLRLAKTVGAVPPEGTKESHREERALYKTAQLASQYGQTAWGFARATGCSEQLAKIVHENLRKAYPAYWSWIDRLCIVSEIKNRISSPLGWTLAVNTNTKRNMLMNYPMQSAGGDILRVATSLMVDEGISILAMVHDAVLIEGSENEIGLNVGTVQDCWKQASRIVLDGFELDSDAKVFRYPETYHSSEGDEMFSTVKQLLSKIVVTEQVAA